jgi:hypothetical protein
MSEYARLDRTDRRMLLSPLTRCTDTSVGVNHPFRPRASAVDGRQLNLPVSDN